MCFLRELSGRRQIFRLKCPHSGTRSATGNDNHSNSKSSDVGFALESAPNGSIVNKRWLVLPSHLPATFMMSFSNLDSSSREIHAGASKDHQTFRASPSSRMKRFNMKIMRHFFSPSYHQSFQCCVNPFAFGGVQ